jgi:heme-degrading monooxygenase HmoA
MIAIIFEVFPAEGRKTDYLEIAAELKPLLEKIDGFISVERFQSLTDPSKLLSLSFFESEHAVNQWRVLVKHRDAQSAGRAGIFENYRIRVAEVSRDYGLQDREQAPDNSKDFHQQ